MNAGPMRSALRHFLSSFLSHFLGLLALLVATQAWATSAPSLTLTLSLEPASSQLEAVAHVRPQQRDFRFVLHEPLSIRTAEANGQALKVSALGKDEAMQSWRIVLPAGSDTLRITYGGKLKPLQTGRDHRSVLHAMPPMASTEGSFLPAASAWYPQPAPMFNYRLTLDLPAEQRGLVPGHLLEEGLPDGASGRYRATFEFKQATDSIDLMAGPWRIREKIVPREGGAGTQPALRLRTYFPATLDAEAGLADAYLEDSRRYIERYSAEIGPYPYSEFSVVASPLPTGFGMPTLTYIGVDVLKLSFIRATSLGHEILHNWWGNGVYVNYAQGNWSEGLTTFMADYAYKEAGRDGGRDMRLGWLRDFSALPSAARLPLRNFRSRTHSASAAVGYGKAAMLFVMLRDHIGEAAFRQGIRDFWAKNQFRVAAWRDLQTAFEAASGQDLKAFFAAWLDSSGAPQLAISAARLNTSGQGYRLEGVVKQHGTPLMTRLPLELSNGPRRETRWLSLKQGQEKFSLDLDFRPQTIRIDPEIRLWRQLDATEMPPILRQWIGAPAPRLLVAARGAASEAATTLAEHFFEVRPQSISASTLASALTAGGPIMIIGTHSEVAASLASAGLPGRPATLSGQGSAQVWTVWRPAGAPLAVIAADDAQALQALMRPLPHYGSQSWLIFAGPRNVDRGIWPLTGASFTIKQEGAGQ